MIKFKSLIVIILSSILISSVILLTIFGLSLYLKWKESEAAHAHMNEIASANASVYGQYLKVQNLKAIYGKSGLYKNKCVIEGVIRNNGYRSVRSVKLNIEFRNKSGKVIFTEHFRPLRSYVMRRRATMATLSAFIGGKERPLLPGEQLHFKHILSEQKNKDIVSPIKHKKYATNPDEWSGKLHCETKAIKF